MKYLKRVVLILSFLMLLFGVMVISASAQRRVYRRPVIIYHYPFYDPFYYDPFYSERQNRYYRERAVESTRRELEKHKQKYYADGVITDKERKELIDDEKDYAEAVRNLRRYRGYY